MTVRRNPRVLSSPTVYKNPWFEVIAKSGVDFDQPYYVLRTSDYVTVVPVTDAREVVFVKQYRPALERYTTELPSGHVETGEEPAAAALRELLEETGYEATSLAALGALHPDTGRMTNRLWSFVAKVRKVAQPEEGIELVLRPIESLVAGVCSGDLSNALDLAVLAKAAAGQHL